MRWMMSRTLSARDETAWSALAPLGLPVGTGGQNSMIQLDGSPNGASADHAVSSLADHVRDIIQRKVDELLAERGPAFT